MPGDDAVKELVMELSKIGVLVAADVRPETLEGFSMNDITSRLIEDKLSDPGMTIVSNAAIEDVIKRILQEKIPRPIEVIHNGGYHAISSDIDANYSIAKRDIEYSNGVVDGFVSHFRSRLGKLRSIVEEHRASISGMVSTLEGLSSYSSGREVTIVGIIYNRITTKNGNIMVVLEDETAQAKIMFMNGTSQQARDLFEKARHLVNDETIAIKGKISGPFIIASEIIWPDVPIHERKRSEDDVAIAFISDIHIGSKVFLEKNFSNFISWLNGGYSEQKDLASKIKYLVVGGDVVDGIGVYPNQDRDLTVLDIYTQYRIFFNFMSMIPDYIHVFVIPGNHDAVQRAEPQPQLGPELLGDFKSDNVHILPNPSYLTLHGVDVLTYHGTSLDSVISAIPGTSYSKPEKPMVEILKRRHLSPIYGGNIIVPSKNDSLVIDAIPDILHMGHVHKNGMANYHGVDIINSGTWQATTDYQLMQGHIPSPGIVPIYETKHGRFTTVSFVK